MFKSLPRRLALPVGTIVCLTATGLAQAETAETLPAGIAKVRYQITSGYASQGFDSDGERKSLGELYRAALEGKGLTTAVPSVYSIDTGARYEFQRHDLYLQYGLTNEVSLGLWTYFVDQKTSYSASLQQQAGWGMLPAANQAAITAASAAADSADGSSAGLGDTVLGVKHRLLGHHDSQFRFAYGLGARLPTGHVADPTQAGDLSVGDGQTDLGLWLAFDWQATPNLLLNVHSRHEYQFEGRRDVLDPADATRTLSQAFQPGFYHYLELYGRYRIPRPDFNVKLELTAIYENEGAERRQSYDTATGSYHGAMGTVQESDSTLLRLEPQIGIDLFPSEIPLELKLYGGLPISGHNSVAPEYAGFRFDAYW